LSRNEKPAGWVRRLWRDIYWYREDRRIRTEYRGVRHLVFFGGHGLGDEVMVSTVLHELRQRGGQGLGVMTTVPELFANSPDVDAVKPIRHDHTAFFERVGIRADPLYYIHRQLPPDIDVPPPRHLLAEMCRLAGITGEVALRPYVFLTEREKGAARRTRPFVVLQSSRRSASLRIGNKEWIPERIQAVADALAAHHEILQVGLQADPAIAGAVDLRGRLTLRETAAVLYHAQVFVGLVGFLMHLARSVDCPAVIIYGGREHPGQSGYSANENLFTPLPCSPCWRWNSCDYDHLCMTSITVEAVLAATQRIMARPRDSLVVDRAATD
jgi:hypothetical protein